MNYPINYIDGIRYIDQNPLPQQNISRGQFDYMKEQIIKQKKGAWLNTNYWM